MTDRQKETREQKIQKLEDGSLKGRKKADFYYKSAKSLSNDLDNLKELSRLLKLIPDSYLRKIDFIEAATFAMELTEILIEKARPAHISQELLDGSIHAERFYTVELGNGLPGLKNATMNLGVNYRPTKEDIRFYQRLLDHKNHVVPVIADHGKYPLSEFVKETLPAIKAKDPDVKITNRGIIGYKPPEEFELTEEPKPMDPKLLDAIEKLAMEIGTGLPQNITAIPDYPTTRDEVLGLLSKGDYAGAAHEVIVRQKREEPK